MGIRDPYGMPGGPSRPPPPPEPTFRPPEYVAPQRDVGRIEELRTKAAAPGVRAATRGIQQALLKEYRNPNLARLALRDILGGHGQALSSIYGGATRTSLAQYAPEWAGAQEESMTNWRGRVEAEKRRYEIELEKYYRNR